MYQITTELDLSPHVIRHWKDRGFCVHGEVAVYGKSIFIDHVAHKGPCDDPTYVVAIEMKRGASKSLRSQMWTIDRRHVSDEIWGVTIATPRSSTLKKWDNAKRQANWIKPGLLSWTGDGFSKHRKSHVTLRDYHKRYYRKKSYQLLLVPENKGCLAGYPSGEQEYITHWSLGCDRILKWARQKTSGFTTQDLYDNLPKVLNAYRKRRSAMNRMLRYLEEEGHLAKTGKAGRFNKYAAVDYD
jgi:hypothetical protein